MTKEKMTIKDKVWDRGTQTWIPKITVPVEIIESIAEIIEAPVEQPKPKVKKQKKEPKAKKAKKKIVDLAITAVPEKELAKSKDVPKGEYTIKQYADKAGVNRQYIWYMVTTKKLNARQLGKLWIITVG